MLEDFFGELLQEALKVFSGNFWRYSQGVLWRNSHKNSGWISGEILKGSPRNSLGNLGDMLDEIPGKYWEEFLEEFLWKSWKNSRWYLQRIPKEIMQILPGKSWRSFWRSSGMPEKKIPWKSCTVVNFRRNYRGISREIKEKSLEESWRDAWRNSWGISG